MTDIQAIAIMASILEMGDRAKAYRADKYDTQSYANRAAALLEAAKKAKPDHKKLS